jgi:hypothetical protein
MNSTGNTILIIGARAESVSPSPTLSIVKATGHRSGSWSSSQMPDLTSAV